MPGIAKVQGTGEIHACTGIFYGICESGWAFERDIFQSQEALGRMT